MASTTLDKLFVAIALAGLFAFCGVVVWSVAIPDLTITIVLVLFLACNDFWISVFRPRGGDHPAKMESGLEQLPTGDSGHPLPGSTRD